MTPAERAKRALPCIGNIKHDHIKGLTCIRCELRPAVEREIAEAVEAERARVLRLLNEYRELIMRRDERADYYTELEQRIENGAEELL